MEEVSVEDACYEENKQLLDYLRDVGLVQLKQSWLAAANLEHEQVVAANLLAVASEEALVRDTQLRHEAEVLKQKEAEAQEAEKLRLAEDARAEQLRRHEQASMSSMID